MERVKNPFMQLQTWLTTNRTIKGCKLAWPHKVSISEEFYVRSFSSKSYIVTRRCGRDWARPCAEISCIWFQKHCSSPVICIQIECELCCLSCVILNIVCRMDVIDSATALHIKWAQHRHIGIIHSGNRGLQDHQMNIKPLIKAKLWHDTLPGSWAASPNKRMLDDDQKWWRGWDVSMFYS